MAKSSWISNVSDGDFQEAVLERSRDVPVVVDFWAPWCAPCRMLAPVLEKLIDERRGDVLLVKVNVDEAQETAGRYGIMSIPAVVAFKGGEPVLDFIGLLPEPEIRDFLDRLVPSPAERLARQGLALEKEKPAEAEKLYRQALELDRGQTTALLGLARLLMDQNKDAEAGELLENVAGGEAGEDAERLQAILFLRDKARGCGSEADLRQRLQKEPDNPRAHFELGCVLALAGCYPDALAELLAAGQRDSQLASSQVRETMVKIFQIVGVRSPLADEYRDKLANLLY